MGFRKQSLVRRLFGRAVLFVGLLAVLVAVPLAVSFSVSTARAQDAAPYRDLILVAGQSNAVGYDAKPSELPPSQLDKDVIFWWRCGDPPPDEHDSIGATWSPLRPQPLGRPITPRRDRQYGNFAQAEGGFGPEIGLARTLLTKQPERRLAIVKAAFSGTGIRTDWDHANAGDQGSCYRALLHETRSALQAARDDGQELRLRGLAWVQGESDANAEDAPKYASRLRDMIGALRRDLKAPKLVVLLAVNTRFLEGQNQFMPQIVAAQREVAESDPLVAYVDTSRASIANPVHFDAPGTLEVGRLFAESLLALENRPR